MALTRGGPWRKGERGGGGGDQPQRLRGVRSEPGRGLGVASVCNLCSGSEPALSARPGAQGHRGRGPWAHCKQRAWDPLTVASPPCCLAGICPGCVCLSREAGTPTGLSARPQPYRTGVGSSRGRRPVPGEPSPTAVRGLVLPGYGVTSAHLRGLWALVALGWLRSVSLSDANCVQVTNPGSLAA